MLRRRRLVPAPAHTSSLSRPARLTLGCLAAVAIVGFGATVYGFAQAGGFPRLPPALLAATPLVVAATIANLVVRFVRWQFLLRRLGVRLPTIPALGAFIGSFGRWLIGPRLEPLSRSLRVCSDHFAAQTGWRAARPKFEADWLDVAREDLATPVHS